ncbi:cytochrome P450 [Kitasatospora sp. NBC_01300]|uniref:cytochrome P450 n=1 Tax=Kitasatospora sp. NBC_01300 TaxID=2903574 RepID=UPI00352FE159|nr:cytochrome P450 [Kitasatospora sp. NBC_01300]
MGGNNMDQATVLAALSSGPERKPSLTTLAEGPRAIDCPDLGSGRLVFPRHREVRHLLRHPGFVCAPTAAGLLDEISPALRSVLEPVTSWVLYADAPEHQWLRGLLAKAFAPRRIAALEPQITATADALVSRFMAADGGDAVRSIAEPLPVHTICALLGIPDSDQGLVKRWSNEVILLTEPALTGDQEQRLAAAWAGLWDYFTDLIGHRRARAVDDIVSALVEVEEQGKRLTLEEAVANLIALLIGGHETTTGLIGALLIAIADHPELADAAAGSAESIAGFVEEVLRLDGPALITARTAAEDCEVFGVPVPAGRRLVLLQASANRDPEVFEEPQEFRPGRRPNPHVGFGHGPHACFGAALARMEAAAVMRSVLRRGCRLHVEDGVTWKASQVIRSATFLPVYVEREAKR